MLTRTVSKRGQERQHIEMQQISTVDTDKALVITESEKKKSLFFIVFILIVSGIVFHNSLPNDFINWDDNRNVYENLYIRDITVKNLATYFTKPLLAMYTPLVYLSYALDYKIGRLNPAAYHTTNLLLHMTNIVLVFFAVRLFVQKVEIAATAALIFGIHPMNVGAVAPVSVRSSLLYSAFYLAAYISYITYLKKNYRLRYIVLSFILFLLSALSKSAAVVFPLLLVLTDWYYQRKFNGKILIEKLPFVIASVVFGILTIVFRVDAGHMGSRDAFALYERVFLVSYTLIFYIVKLFIPINLSAYYPYPEKMSGMLPWAYYITPFILATIVFAIIKTKRYRREVVFGSLFFMFHIVLTLKLIPMGGEIAADRYTYLPYIGLLMIMGWWYGGLHLDNRKRLYVVVSCLILILFFSLLSYQRSLIWKDSLTLFDDVLKKYPRVVAAYNNRGLAKTFLGDYAGALKDYDNAIAIDPLFYEAYNNRGLAKTFLGDYAGALKDYDKAIAIYPLSHEVYNNRGIAKKLLGDYAGALKDYDKAIAIYPLFYEAYNNRGMTKTFLGDYAGALKDSDAAIAINPIYHEAYNNKGTVKTELGDYQAAISDFTRAIELFPDNGAFWLKRGVAKFSLNKDLDACDDWQKAFQLGIHQAEVKIRQHCSKITSQ